MGAKRVFVRTLVFALLLFQLPLIARAQLNRGSIEGIVTDPQGAVVPSVSVTVTNVDTNVAQTTKTDTAGYYRVVDLVPGTYSVHCVAIGFANTDMVNIQVFGAQVTRADTQLKIGQALQRIEVTGTASLVQTEASNASTNLGKSVIQEMPLAGRDSQQLVFLVPGVNSVFGPPGSNFGFNSQDASFPDPTHVQGSNLSVNGGQGGANAWYLDGNFNVSGLAGNIVVSPSPDAIEEFNVVTNAFAAQYSGTGGAIFSEVLKSGTNAIHGNLYEYVRNSATSARNPFTSIDSLGNIIPQNVLHYNDFGGTIGGPVVIPHVYNGRNKTFFFFSWDANILHLAGNKAFTVPTPAMQQGDFSEDPNTALYGIWDPFSTVGPNSQGLFQRTAFGTPVAGNPYGAQGCLNSSVEAGSAAGISTCNFASQVPANRFDPVAMFYMKSFPAPNYLDPLVTCPVAMGGAFRICDNYLGGVGSSQDGNNISVKVDEQLGEKDKMFFEWLYNPGHYNNYQVPWTGPTFPQDEVGFNSSYPFWSLDQIIALGQTHVFSPTFINQFRASFTRQSLSTHPGTPYNVSDETQVEQEIAPTMFPSSNGYPVPHFGVNSPGGGYMPFGPSSWINESSFAEAYTLLDDITKIIGKHTIKAGFLGRVEHNEFYGQFPFGLDGGFSGSLTEDPTTTLGGGSGLAQFMLGAPSTGFGGILDPSYDNIHTWGGYVQDDYRASRRLTINLGLRYDLYEWYSTRYPYNANFCLSCNNPLTGLPGQVVFPKQGPILPANRTDLGPRINFAYSPSDKTVLRWGYDIFYSSAVQASDMPGQGGGSTGPGWEYADNWEGSFYPNQCAPFTSQCVIFPLSDTTTNKASLMTPPLPSGPPAVTKDPQLGESYMHFTEKSPRDPTIQEWNFQVQRSLPGDMLLTVGYVGTHGTQLMGPMFKAFDYIHTADKIKYKTAISSDVPASSIFSNSVTLNALAQTYGSTNLPLSLLLMQYPFFGATANQLTPTTAYNGSTIYHALDVRLEKRFSHGLIFNVAYTWSKEIDNGGVGNMESNTVDPVHWLKAGNIGGRAASIAGQYNGPPYQDPDNIDGDRTIAADDIPQMLNVFGVYQLPVGNGRSFLNHKGILNDIVGGWSLTANFTAQSGLPLNISGPCDGLTCRPNLVGNPKAVPGGQTQNDWINPAAFQPVFGPDNNNFWAQPDPNSAAWWQLGSAGLNLPSIRAPGYWNVDSSLKKDFHVTESKVFEFRWELYNMFNHQNLGAPNAGYCLPALADGTTDLVHQASCQFGRITNVQTDPRSMEFSLKFAW